MRQTKGRATAAATAAHSGPWWTTRWLDAVTCLDTEARARRGLSYARGGRVLSLHLEPGRVVAKVQGSRPDPYTVAIRVQPLPDSVWNHVLDAMASKALFAAKLLAGHLPQELEDVFQQAGSSLFPRGPADFWTDCSCPDWANPCKHVMAVFYTLAEEMAEDPFVLFTLRGRTKRDLLSALRTLRSAASQADGTAPQAGGTAASTAAGAGTDAWTGGTAGARSSATTSAGVSPDLRSPSPFRVGQMDLMDLLRSIYQAARLWAAEAAVGRAAAEAPPPGPRVKP